jgi:CubicO group peptidase (beta-lactamase class C family)
MAAMALTGGTAGGDQSQEGAAVGGSNQEARAPAAPHAYVQYTVPSPAGAGRDLLLPEILDAKRAGVDPAALSRLLEGAKLSHSDALVILKDGRLLGDWRFDQPAEPIELGSITKSVAGLAIGRLLQSGRIRSLDEPVARFYPEWKGGPKQAITLRQLMSHTSGLRAQPDPQGIYASADLVQLALDADLVAKPGTRFFYDHKAVALLAGIVRQASGRKLDEYLRDQLFAPLGVRRFAWMRDPAGNPDAFSGLQLDARDLARIGQLMLDGGVYGGRRLLSAEFVRESVHAAQPFSPTGGLLWWVIPEWTKLVIDPALLDTWRKGGAEPAFLQAVAPLAGREIPRDELWQALDRAFGHDNGLAAWVENVPGHDLPTPKTTTGPPIGFASNGALGQYLVVLTGPRLVAVRQIRQHAGWTTGDDFDGFEDLVRTLAPAAAAKAAGRRRPVGSAGDP